MIPREYRGRPRATTLVRDWEWFREKALRHTATLKRALVHPATALAFLHFLLMLWVRGRWRSAIQEFGIAAGPQADFASDVASWVDFAVSWVCESLAYGNGQAPSPRAYALLSFFGVRSHADLTLSIHWPLLLLLGTLQWVAIGFGVAYLRGRRQASPVRATRSRLPRA
jgi:hypothetical protein